MNRKLLLGAAAGVAAVGLAVGGTTYAAFSDFGDISGNSVAAGTLQLQLGANGQGDAPMNFGHLVPGAGGTGDVTGRTIWVASNSKDSSPNANLTVTIKDLKDIAAPCSTSLGKVQGELASGISGCSIGANDTIQGDYPAQGNLSRVLAFQLVYYPTVTDPTKCVSDVANWNAGVPEWAIPGGTYPGNLYRAAAANNGQGAPMMINDVAGKPLSLTPGQGICLAINAKWSNETDDPNRASYNNGQPGGTGTPDDPTDNAAQGDSLTFAAHFDLTQDMSAPLPVPNP